MFENQRAHQLKALAVTPQWQALLELAKELQDEIQKGRQQFTPGSTTAEQVGLDAVHRDGRVTGIRDLIQRVNREIDAIQRSE